MEAESTGGGWALMDEPAYKGVKARDKEWVGARVALAGVQPRDRTTDVAMMMRMGRTCAIDKEEVTEPIPYLRGHVACVR
eukprot:6712790-Prymnesium_polylepis.1